MSLPEVIARSCAELYKGCLERHGGFGDSNPNNRTTFKSCCNDLLGDESASCNFGHGEGGISTTCLCVSTRVFLEQVT